MPYRSAYPLRRSHEYAPDEEARVERRSSHAAIPFVVVLLGVGLYLGTVTVLIPVLFGFVLLLAGGTLLSTRINPFSVGFYLTTKPSWAAIGLIFLSALILFYAGYYYVAHGIGPVFPHTW